MKTNSSLPVYATGTHYSSSANQDVERVLSDFYFWRQKIHGEDGLNQVQTRFTEAKSRMREALAAAENWQ